MRSILVAMLVVAVFGCSPKPVQVAPHEEPVEPAAAEGSPVDVGEADAGPIALVLGQELIIRLESNRTTGYSWALAPSEAPVLAPIEVAYVPDEAPSGVVGAGGIEILRFSAQQAGTQTLTLRYARPWETEVPPAKELIFTVTVK